MSFLEISGITKRFGATLALDNVSFEAESGEVHALVGENGSGKSTLMRILAGAIEPDAGSMKLGGEPYKPRDPMSARRAGVAMIHQELSICGDLSIGENIVLGLEETTGGVLKLGAIRAKAKEALGQLGYENLEPDMPAKLAPIATRQIVEIARAVAMGSRLVILDEPTSSLTEADVEHLFKVVGKLREGGCCVVYISHFLDEIHRLADRLTVLRDGNMVGVRPVKGITDDEVVRLMVGRNIDEMYPRSPRSPGETILEVNAVRGVKKPEQASFQLRRGEVLGIAGLNGSGRTELLRTIFGLDPVRSGQIRVGTFSGYATPAERWRERVGMLSEDRKEEGLLLNLAIAENITMASLYHLTVSPKEQAESSKQWIENLSIKCQGPEQPVGQLSGGNQQKVALARMLHHGVDVLLLDEPTRGIDVGSKEQIYRLIDRLALEGKAVLMVSSYLPELLGTCDRIAVMRKGVLSEAIPGPEATQEILMQMAVG